ncbi:type IV secretion system protein VirB3 [Alphaproteobacteria bacterium]
MEGGVAMEEGLRADTLFVGLTRPPLLFGVSYMFALLNFFVCMLAYVATNQFKYLFTLFPVHALGCYVCSKEPLFLELFIIKAQKCSRNRNKAYHGGNSYDPY